MKVLGVLFVAIFGLLVFLQSMTGLGNSSSGCCGARAVENYIQGHATGNGDFMRKALIATRKSGRFAMAS